MATIVLVAPAESYRTADFLRAATTLRIEAVVAGDAPHPLGGDLGAPLISVDLADPETAGAAIAEAVPDAAAVIAVDDPGVLAANAAARRLGVRHNPVAAVAATRDKVAMRHALRAANIAQPVFAAAGPGDAPRKASAIGFPAVIKPASLSASRGVTRVEDAAQAARAESRIRALLVAECGSGTEPLLVERYIAGDEVAVEGLLGPEGLEVLAVIDKPEPAIGPYFAETFLTTPSRLPHDRREAAVTLVRDSCAALGLVTGPIHAEVRIGGDGAPYLIEIAARSIGGLCSRALTFGFLGESLEVLILRGALGWDHRAAGPARLAAGVLMLPVPSSGLFTGLDGADRAAEVPGIDAVEITVHEGAELTALPDGTRYVGFVFASGEAPATVEASLRAAAAELTVVIDGEAVDPLHGQAWQRT
ncbi:MAG: ATP-grasp domain-containing protein [Acidimicrobiia bacterium]|nr:MAG: ATP-grasp domain-containing protein [Acidimicrobiia bacterium]